MRSVSITKLADQAGIRRKALPVFLLVRHLMSENADLRCAAAYRWIADEFDLPEARVRASIDELVRAGWLEAETKSRRYKMLKLGAAYYAAVDEAENRAQKRAPDFRKIQPVLIKSDAEINAQKNATGVTVVMTLPLGVDVPLFGLKEDLKDSLVASSEATPDRVPYEELRAAYNQRRGALPEARAPLSEPARRKMRTRWREHPDIAFWSALFDKAGRSQQMVTWASLHWLINSEMNIEKTLNGNYDNDREHKVVPSMRPIVRRYSEPVIDEADLPDAAFLLEHRRKNGLVKVGA